MMLKIFIGQKTIMYLVNNALESIDFVDNDDIFKKELTIKYDSEPGFYLKKKKFSL